MKPHDFRVASAKATANDPLVQATRKTADILHRKREEAASAYPGFEALRDWGRSRKLEVSGSLEGYVGRFAERLEKAGGVAHFARNAAEAAGVVRRIAEKHGVRTAVKTKSMTAEEVHLNEALMRAGVSVTETDLGEFIIQLAGEKPSHILAPAIHRNRGQVAELFGDALGAPPGLDVEGLVRAARHALRARFLGANLGITGANFAVAETGTLVLVTNEGNGRLTTTLPRIHIAIVGIDKVIPSLSDVPGFLTLLTRSASGQTISSYVTLITGPKKRGEEEGPEELHVVLLDNGRSALAGGAFREMLHCLHCGACLNVCPVYRAVGGHAYGSVYPGPMGDILSPLLWSIDAYPGLPDACTLCGRCAEACPVRIPLPDFHRKLRIHRARMRPAEMLAARLSAVALASPALYRRGLDLVRYLLNHSGRAFVRSLMGPWTSCRDIPRPQQEEDFRSWWRDRGGPA